VLALSLLSSRLAVAGPYDLVVESVDAPSAIQRGQQAVPVAVTIRNTGTYLLPSRAAFVAFALSPVYPATTFQPFAVAPLPSIPASQAERVTVYLNLPPGVGMSEAARLEAQLWPGAPDWRPTQGAWWSTIRLVEPTAPAMATIPATSREPSSLGATRPAIRFAVRAIQRQPAVSALVGNNIREVKTANLSTVLKSATAVQAVHSQPEALATATASVTPGRSLYDETTANLECRIQAIGAQATAACAVNIHLQFSFGLPLDAPPQDIFFLAQLNDVRLEGPGGTPVDAELVLSGLDTGIMVRHEAQDLGPGVSRRVTGVLSGLTMSQSSRTAKELVITARLRAEDCAPNMQVKLAGGLNVSFGARPITSSRRPPMAARPSVNP
jgi:hypothetical protein